MPELYEISTRKDNKIVVDDEKMEANNDQDKIERVQTQHSACYSIA